MNTIGSLKDWSSVLPITLLILLLVIGCGDPGKGTISGKVTYQGKPVSSGFVTFVPEKGTPIHADIQSDGSYRVEKVPIGLVKIGVQPKSGLDTLQSSAMPRNPQDYGKFKGIAETQSKTAIPPQYSDPNQSGLTYTVKKGQQQYDIILK